MWPQLSLGAAPLLLSLLAPLVSAVPTNPTCSNLNGDFAPFCQPISNVTVFLEATQYITWDPAFFKPKAKVKVVGFYHTDDPNAHEEAMASGKIDAAYGFYDWHVEKYIVKKKHADAVNITIKLAWLPHEDKGKQVPLQWLDGPTITVSKKSKGRHPASARPASTNADLYIALPLIFGFSGLLLIVTYVHNRNARRIDLGNITGRRSNREGRFGRKSRRSKNGEQYVRLMDRDAEDDEVRLYPDGSK